MSAGKSLEGVVDGSSWTMLVLNVELWGDEDDDEDEDDEEALSAKQELIQGFNVLGPIVEQAKEMAIQLRDVAKDEVPDNSPLR